MTQRTVIVTPHVIVTLETEIHTWITPEGELRREARTIRRCVTPREPIDTVGVETYRRRI